MGKSIISCVFFGIWIGLILAGSTIIKLVTEDQVYSYRTLTIVSIILSAGFLSGLLSWMFFARFGRSVFKTSIILSLTNIILFCLIGTLVSYVVIILPHYFDPSQDHEAFSMKDFILGIILGYLGSGFSFKTFGLPLLWPLGTISGLIGTFLFVYFNKMYNSRTRH